MSTKDYLLSFVLLLAATGHLPVNAGTGDEDGFRSKPQFSQTWGDLEVRILPEDRKPVSIGSLLQVYRENKLIYSFDPGLYPDSMHTLDDGNLAVLWHHADGAFTLDVFTSRTGKVHNVIHASGGKLRPEYVFQTNAHIMGEGYRDKTGEMRTRGGPFFQQRIIIPLTDWTVTKKSYIGYGHRDYLPLAADIYVWDDKGGTYKVRHRVPWNQRLRSL